MTSWYARTTYGTDQTLFHHSFVGGTEKAGSGVVGYLVELHGMRSDGFRQIDGSGRDSGFRYVEPMVKLFWEPAALP